jgi:hypothetical protein
VKVLATLIFLLVAAISACNAQDASMSTPNAAQPQTDAITSSLRSGRVVRVEILQIPPGVETRTRITPDMLERIYHYKLIIRDIRGGAHGEGLLAAVASTSVTPSRDAADVRWGVIFLDASEHRVGALYLDASGRLGVVDSVPVSFRGDLSNWLNSNFSRAFK